MKLFISADIEGVSGVFQWHQCSGDNERYREARTQMTKEVAALCEVALSHGFDEIMVKDAHNNAYNLFHEMLPKGVRLIRGWSRMPGLMMDGLDDSFDACAFIGYHDGAFTGTNPLAHSFSGSLISLKINGELASEFDVNYYYAVSLGVPTIFFSGDDGICHHVKQVDENIRTVSTKTNLGGSANSKHPESVVEEIKEGLPSLKESFKMEALKDATVEICYKEHVDAVKYSNFPGVTLKGPHTIEFKVKDAHELMVAILFLT